jgi:hypothetical protein
MGPFHPAAAGLHPEACLDRARSPLPWPSCSCSPLPAAAAETTQRLEEAGRQAELAPDVGDVGAAVVTGQEPAPGTAVADGSAVRLQVGPAAGTAGGANAIATGAGATLIADGSATGVSTVRVTGSTTLPDGAVVTIAAFRPFTWVGETEEQRYAAGDISIVVTAGTFTTDLTLDDAAFWGFLDAEGREVAATPGDALVEVRFTPGSALQPPEVQAAYGEDGAGLRGSPQEAVEDLGGTAVTQLLTTFRTPVPLAPDPTPGDATPTG